MRRNSHEFITEAGNKILILVDPIIGFSNIELSEVGKHIEFLLENK